MNNLSLPQLLTVGHPSLLLNAFILGFSPFIYRQDWSYVYSYFISLLLAFPTMHLLSLSYLLLTLPLKESNRTLCLETT